MTTVQSMKISTVVKHNSPKIKVATGQRNEVSSQQQLSKASLLLIQVMSTTNQGHVTTGSPLLFRKILQFMDLTTRPSFSK